MDPLAFSTDDDVSSGSAPGSSSPSGFFNPGSDPNADPNQVLNVRHPESPYGLIQEVLPADKKNPPRVRWEKIYIILL